VQGDEGLCGERRQQCDYSSSTLAAVWIELGRANGILEQPFHYENAAQQQPSIVDFKLCCPALFVAGVALSEKNGQYLYPIS